MKKIVLLFLVLSVNVSAAGLGNLFSDLNKKPAPTSTPTHKPTAPAPKSPTTSPAIQQSTRPVPHPAPVSSKPAAPATPTPAPAKPSDAGNSKSATEKIADCGPTDSTCKR